MATEMNPNEKLNLVGFSAIFQLFISDCNTAE